MRFWIKFRMADS